MIQPGTIRKKSELLAIGISLLFTVVGDAHAVKPSVGESPAERLRNLANPHQFPPDVHTPEGASMRRGRHAEVPGIDYTKDPPAPLKMAPKDNDAAQKSQSADPKKKVQAVETTKKLQIVGSDGKLHPEYLAYLNQFEEKPFSEIKDVGKILRFVLIESAQKPILITVNFKTKSGTTSLNAKKLGKNFQLAKDETIELTPEQAQSLTDKIDYPELWKEVPYTKTSADYSYWILENWDGKKYQTATEFAPNGGYIKELGDELLGLTDLRAAEAAKPVEETKP